MEWIIEPFNKAKHDRSSFDCGNFVLNQWLASKVNQYAKKDLARTYVLVHRESNVVKGYYALSNHTVAFDALPEDEVKGLPLIDVPVVLIGRLAVDRSVQGKRLGEFLLLDALRKVEFLANRIGIRAVEVDAADESAKRFYEKYGFIAFVDNPLHLFLPMHVIRRLNLPPL
ncbi:MAG: GNAT family N-acetyltransferase [Planctomycetes bacterium]|nr:GNAT family N-acetyltransferase [Planctomycetota bacterium]